MYQLNKRQVSKNPMYAAFYLEFSWPLVSNSMNTEVGEMLTNSCVSGITFLL